MNKMNNIFIRIMNWKYSESIMWVFVMIIVIILLRLVGRVGDTPIINEVKKEAINNIVLDRQDTIKPEWLVKLKRLDDLYKTGSKGISVSSRGADANNNTYYADLKYKMYDRINKKIVVIKFSVDDIIMISQEKDDPLCRKYWKIMKKDIEDLKKIGE